MGRGDKRTKRGKIFSGSYGKFRLKRAKRVATEPQTPVQKISSPEPPQATEEEETVAEAE